MWESEYKRTASTVPVRKEGFEFANTRKPADRVSKKRKEEKEGDSEKGRKICKKKKLKKSMSVVGDSVPKTTAERESGATVSRMGMNQRRRGDGKGHTYFQKVFQLH